MVWAIVPVGGLPGDDGYYIFLKGQYKVGRRGCEIIVDKDKGVSRIHAEIIVDAPSKIRVVDCSKYGTFVKRPSCGSAERVHEFPSKETTLNDGDLLQFGTGNATYRVSYLPLVFFPYNLEKSKRAVNSLKEKASSIGARMASTLCECTHVVGDQVIPLNEDFLDMLIAKRPVVVKDWILCLAENRIRNEMLSHTNYTPTVIVDGGEHVKVGAPDRRENCLTGQYTFVVDAVHEYRFEGKVLELLETGGAKYMHLSDFLSTRGAVAVASAVEGKTFVYITTPTTSSIPGLISVSTIKEIDLIRAVVAAHFDPTALQLPSAVGVSCSTDETVVADSETEVDGPTTGASQDRNVNGNGEAQTGNVDVIYSRGLIVRTAHCFDSSAVNFKCFRKRRNESGNSFAQLIPFSKNPYRESDCGGGAATTARDEKKRKEMEALAEDLFNNERARRRGSLGSLHSLLTR